MIARCNRDLTCAKQHLDKFDTPHVPNRLRGSLDQPCKSAQQQGHCVSGEKSVFSASLGSHCNLLPGPSTIRAKGSSTANACDTQNVSVVSSLITTGVMQACIHMREAAPCGSHLEGEDAVEVLRSQVRAHWLLHHALGGDGTHREADVGEEARNLPEAQCMSTLNARATQARPSVCLAIALAATARTSEIMEKETSFAVARHTPEAHAANAAWRGSAAARSRKDRLQMIQRCERQ
eukprot:6197555-Pleurochrysis_carterae.AAC.2